MVHTQQVGTLIPKNFFRTRDMLELSKRYKTVIYRRLLSNFKNVLTKTLFLFLDDRKLTESG